MRKTKIVCTIGPSSRSATALKSLINAGMDVARVNFSHGSQAEHAEAIARIRRIAGKAGKPIAILGDLQGPKIRVGKLINGSMELKKGEQVTLTVRKIPGEKGVIPVDYANLMKAIKTGDKILLDEGTIQLKVESVERLHALCRVNEGGMLKERKGVNLPGMVLKLPSLTKKDRADLDFIMGQKLDYVALSFVRRAEDVQALRRILEKNGSSLQIIAKLEKPQAIENLDAILAAADGVMIARGDLGVEMSLPEVPIVQKEIIKRANAKRVPVITATQMLESMTERRSPTRAEASDVANAIFDGTDAVMLSGETAAGKYPIQAVKTMVSIIEAAERNLPGQPHRRRTRADGPVPFEDAISDAAPYIADAIHARVIVAFTQSGATAKLISKCRTTMPIIAFTPSVETERRMNLYYGVTPYYLPFIQNFDEVASTVTEYLKKRKCLKKGDNIVLLMGASSTKEGSTDLIYVHRVF